MTLIHPGRLRAALGAAALVAFGAGCMTDTYRIPHEALHRVVDRDPVDRGVNLRVVQRIGPVSEPGAAHPGAFVAYEQACAEDPGCAAAHLVDAAIEVPSRSRLALYRKRLGPAPEWRPNRPPPPPSGGPTTTGTRPPPIARGDVTSGRSTAQVLQGISGDKDAAILLVALAAVGTVALAATEGSRYDGWVTVDPNHPVHLIHRDGTTETLPLAQLEASDLRGAPEAVIRLDEGRGAYIEGRAPLSRQGFTWKMEGGALEVPLAEGVSGIGPAATMQLGYFPTQYLGLLATLSLTGGSEHGGEYFASRYGVEAQLLPLRLARLHFGLYGWLGPAFTEAAGGLLPTIERSTLATGGGLLAEIDVTTRLAVSLRVGAMAEPGEDLLDGAMQASLGLAVY